MDLVVIGAGAVGGVIGGHLARAGHRVGLIARGRHLDVIEALGLRVDTPAGSTTYALPVSDRVAGLPFAPEVAIVATKLQDFAGAVADLDPARSEERRVGKECRCRGAQMH